MTLGRATSRTLAVQGIIHVAECCTNMRFQLLCYGTTSNMKQGVPDVCKIVRAVGIRASLCCGENHNYNTVQLHNCMHSCIHNDTAVYTQHTNATTPAGTQTHTHTHTQPRIHIHTQIHKPKGAQLRAYNHVQTQIITLVQLHGHMCTHIHEHTHTHARVEGAGEYV